MPETTEAQTENSLLAGQEETTPVQWFSAENADIVKQKGWGSGDDVIQGYSNLEKMSSGMAKLPTPESSAEEIAQFYRKTGTPENIEGYEIEVPEGIPIDEEGMNAVKQIAIDNGVSKQGFEAVVKSYLDGMSESLIKGREQGETQLREELGDKYDESLKIAQRFCGTCSDEFKELLESTGLGNHPVFVKEFVAKGKQILGDTLIKGTQNGETIDKDYKPQYPNSPELYSSGEDDESKKARAWHTAHGHTY